MRKFLEQVADYYMEPARRSHIEDYTFVFPNRRSGRFLKRYIQQRADGTMFMPRFVTIGSLVARMAGTPEASQRKSLFELYAAYRDVLAALGSAMEAGEFDRFIFWGQLILGDFEEIDRNGVDASALYTNLGRLREISANYLDESQKAVIRELWGENAVPESTGRFWNHMQTATDEEIKEKFLSLWELLPDIYERFVERLRMRGYTTSGRQYRDALLKLRDQGERLLAGTHYVFVGFSNITAVEYLIFDKLKQMKAADFFWDTTSPFVADGHGGIRKDHAAFRALARLVRKFPMPSDFRPYTVDAYPEICIAGLPSRSAQAKLAAAILAEWIEQGRLKLDDPIETAIIVPDESLLMHVLHSLPEEIRAINITMGLPFAVTSFAALLRSVVSMQLRARKVHGEWRFFYEDVLEVTGHPHLRTAAGREGNALHDHIIGRNLYTVEAAEIAAIAPSMAFIFRAVEDVKEIGGVRTYLSELLEGLALLFAADAGAGAKWEINILDALRRDIDEISAMVEEYGVEAGEKSYFTLFERTLRGMTINMAGTPLKGLQIMSVAETRGLDFDNVLFLSMNERIFPQRSATRTMIPNNLRAGYGLPPTDRAETDSAYYFYRLIGRAERVALLYDSRDAGSGTGEVSRFITQLRYLYPDCPVSYRNVDVGATAPDKRIIEVAKTGIVGARLKRFLAGGPAYISASALKNFKHCGLKFYLNNVCRLSGEEAVTEFMNMASFGTIFHASAQAIYDDYKDRELDAAMMLGIRQGLAERYAPVVEALINKHYYHREDDGKRRPMPLEGQIMRDLMLDILAKMFELENKKWTATGGTFSYSEGEMEIARPWNIDPGLAINFKMKIDRVDRTAEGLRFIDYKTGRDVLNTKLEKVFDPEESSTDAVLQILAYCEAYAAITGYDGPIQPSLYIFLDMIPHDEINDICLDGVEVKDYRCVSDVFLPRLKQLIRDIFDESKPFSQAPESSRSCNYCVFAPMCGRVKTDKD